MKEKVRVGQLWRFKTKVVKSAMKKFIKEGNLIVDYEIEAILRLMTELKIKIISIDNTEIKSHVTFEDVSIERIVNQDIKIPLEFLLKEFEIDEFSE